MESALDARRAGAILRLLQHNASFECLGPMEPRPNDAKLFQVVFSSGLASRCDRTMGSQTLAQLRNNIRQLKYEIVERKRVEEAWQHSRAQLREVAAYHEQVKEDERKRIAREIHDDFSQNQLVLRIAASLLHERTASSHSRLHQKVGQTLEHIDAIIPAVQVIINNLRPAVLDLGLDAAIESQLREFERRTGIRCILQSQVADADFEMYGNRATAFFRILQESLTNVARHAQATEVRIQL